MRSLRKMNLLFFLSRKHLLTNILLRPIQEKTIIPYFMYHYFYLKTKEIISIVCM